jgi:hypothetical protein
MQTDKVLIGKTFTRLTVIKYLKESYKYLCRCECGKELRVNKYKLESGHTKSCGCFARDCTIKRSTKHGFANAKNTKPEYCIWQEIKARCFRESHRYFMSYGGRGIGMDDTWAKDFLSFYNHVGNRPSNKHSIDRIDNNKGYIPGNVRWATQTEQCRNTRKNKIVTYKGKTGCIADWADWLNISYYTLHSRLGKCGWTIEKALTTPVGK